MKTINKYTIILSYLLLSNILYAQTDLYDESVEKILSMDSELKADIGSRDGARNYLNSNTPVDVITQSQIENSGLTSLTNILRYFVAGFNAPETSVSDGTDHIRVFSLRGMSPDQVLVLINGKRVHTSALLHVNGTIGRGSSNVDLDTISVASIQRVEIMRDGAAAQYGSDAISGVINIILKGVGHKNRVSVHTGARSKGDGKLLQADAFITIPLKYDGFINLTLDASQQEQTQRAGLDSRLSPPSQQTHAGIPDSTNYKAVLNAEIPQANDINIYSHMLFNHRDSEASTFYRAPGSDPSNPNGFLPMMKAEILDYSALLGIKGEEDGVKWDFSHKYAQNSISYSLRDSMNYSLGTSSPNSFNNGGLGFIQNTTNLELSSSAKKYKIAGGLEFRHENYTIEAGEDSSYDGTGSQGFVGYKPENEVDADRYSYAFYIDLTFNLSKKLSLNILSRYEEYSDFGESTNAKVAMAYKLSPKLMFRTSGSTGFRAPSLSQSFYSQTSSFVDLNTNSLSDQGTFRPDHEVSVALGATPLRSERSKNFSIGTVFTPTKTSSFMVDFFHIEVNDRIMLTGDLRGTTAEQTAILAKHNVSEARYFTNAAKTRTQGVDVRYNQKYLFENTSTLNLSFWYNYSQNAITGSSSETERVRVEDGQPIDSLRLLSNYEIQKLNFVLNISRFGEYKQVMSDNTYTFDAAWTADMDISYKVTKDIKVAIGGTNVFDAMPNKWDGLNGVYYGSNGIKPYSRYSPFGYSGAYYYLRTSIKF